jgi:DNA-binding NarL/FixJ family response regulator
MTTPTAAKLEPPETGRRHLRLLTDPAGQPGACRTTSNAPIRVLIAHGQALPRAAYHALLGRYEDIEVVGEATSSRDAVAQASATGPCVALLDLGLPGLDEPEACFAIASHPAFAGAAVMLMTESEGDEERILSALRAGAVGVLQKDDPPTTLIESVRLLARGQALLPANAIRRLLSELRPRPVRREQLTRRLEELTDREREVVGLAAEGLTNTEIAARLVISRATAKTHVSRAMVKLRARHRAELVAFAYEIGLNAPSEQPFAA